MAKHPPRKLVNKARCRGKSTRLIDEPSGNGRRRLVTRPLRGRQLRFLGQDQIAPFGKRGGPGLPVLILGRSARAYVIAPDLSTDGQSVDMTRRN